MSLVQSLILLSIVTMMMTQGIASFTNLMTKYHLNGAVQSAYFLLQQARSQAISMQQNITVDFQSGGNWCLGITNNTTCDCQVAHSCTIHDIEYRVIASDFPQVNLSKHSFGNNQSLFDATRGLSVGYAGSFWFDSDRYELKLLLSNMGRIRICANQQAFSPYPAC